MSCNRRSEQIENPNSVTLNRRDLERECERKRLASCERFLICEDFGFIGDTRILDCVVIRRCSKNRRF
jgi:hypothetical protein